MSIPFEQLPDDAFVRFPVVLAVTGLRKSQTYVEIKEGRFPAPYKLTLSTAE